MHFCSECHNMYYLKIKEDDEEEGGDSNILIYYCRNCGHEDATLSAESICVSNTQFRRSEQNFTHIVNEYTKYDPTLPRINTIKCPNHECISNTASMAGGASSSSTNSSTNSSSTNSSSKKSSKDENTDLENPASNNNGNNGREVIYIRYDDVNMKYVYLCVRCDTTWKTDNR